MHGSNPLSPTLSSLPLSVSPLTSLSTLYHSLSLSLSLSSPLTLSSPPPLSPLTLSFSLSLSVLFSSPNHCHLTHTFPHYGCVSFIHARILFCRLYGRSYITLRLSPILAPWFNCGTSSTDAMLFLIQRRM